ncbi:hypothetical protein K3495_g14670, partial [Podosphaera aphanis]
MDGQPFVVSALINNTTFANAIIGTGCLSYGLCDSSFAQKNNLKRLKIRPREVIGFDGKVASSVRDVAVVNMDLDGHRQSKIFLYAAPTGYYDVILGMPWIISEDARINGPRSEMLMKFTGIIVRSKDSFLATYDRSRGPVQISAVAFEHLSKNHLKDNGVHVFAASMSNINKALAGKQRGIGIDHKIDVEVLDGQETKIPWGPLYSMSRDELLVLRKTLTELLDKGFIRVSNSPEAAPVLFVKKPGGGLRFCVDYRGLNRITRKDRYPLPLIYETLRNISKAKWFTKLDVIAAFHKIRIAEGDEWKTAFRTRYGLYEWLVTPFGLANAPSTFQKYINWTLREYLDNFCSAYVDDILIYSSESKLEHQEHVRKVLQRLRAAGLQIDIYKCEFETKRTKYLGFIIEAGKGLQMDPEKIEAIKIGKLQHQFIYKFAELAKPLTDLTRKDCEFQWNSDADLAFRKLKEIFISAPALGQFDYDKPTRIETDSSG